MHDYFAVPSELAVRVAPPVMAATVTALFEALGMAGPHAAQCAETLLYADRRGIDSHGVSNMFPYYVADLRAGRINATPSPLVVRETPATATLDCDRGLGLAVAADAMRLAVAKAQAVGMGTVVAGNGRHFGAAAYHAHLAADAGCIGVAMTVGGIQVTPTFGAKPMLGLNPIAVAVPAGDRAPFVFDASMSSVAGNKIRIAKRLGLDVKPGWIAEEDGTPIMDARPVPDRFHMLPLGGTRDLGSHKGYGLALIVDILSGMLAGTGPGYANVGNISHHCTAYRIDAFCDPEWFATTMAGYLDDLAACPPAPGCDRVVYAGQVEAETEAERTRNGIPYHRDVVRYFVDLAAELGVDTELPTPA
ncbi:MAG: Ldh family oxidoreductase [Acidimicrobiia bacterium]